METSAEFDLAHPLKARQAGMVSAWVELHAGEILTFALLAKEAALPFLVEAFPPSSAQAGPSIAHLDARARCLRREQGRLAGRLTERHLREEQPRTRLTLRAPRRSAAGATGPDLEADRG